MNRNEIIEKLSLSEAEQLAALYAEADAVKSSTIGNKVYFRGLIEFSNVCAKNCYYCGIRRENQAVERYEVSDEEVLAAVDFAWKNRYGSVVLQSGEQQSARFTQRITTLLHSIKQHTRNEIGITLSCGEQSVETYREWFEAGAHRYLLRIETSDKDLYHKIHPNNLLHSYEKRLEAIRSLQKIGYQTGTGVMIGLPFQTIENLADDILFFKNLDVDMIGMGPYVEHSDTPLYEYKDSLCPLTERFNLTLKMIAICRIMFKDINIVASTAMQAIDAIGREKAIKAGANIIMPNLTPQKYRENYLLYQNKPCTNEEAYQCKKCLENRIRLTGHSIGYGEWGDAKHYFNRQ